MWLLCIYIYIYKYVYVCVCVYMCVYIHAYIYNVYICMYIYIRTVPSFRPRHCPRASKNNLDCCKIAAAAVLWLSPNQFSVSASFQATRNLLPTMLARMFVVSSRIVRHLLRSLWRKIRFVILAGKILTSIQPRWTGQLRLDGSNCELNCPSQGGHGNVMGTEITGARWFLSFCLGFRRPNLITGLSGWRVPD